MSNTNINNLPESNFFVPVFVPNTGFSKRELCLFVNNGNLGELIVPLYNEQSTAQTKYNKGDYCIHDRKLYKCINDNGTYGPWVEANNWDQKLLINVINETVSSSIESLGTVLTYKDSKEVTQLNSDTDLRHKGYVYSITGANGTLVDSGTEWDGKVTAGDEVVWVGAKTTGHWVYLGNLTNLDDCIKKSDLSAIISSEYSSSKTYNIDDIVYNELDKRLYKCKENNVTGVWDLSKWDELTIDVFKGATANSNAAPGLVPKATVSDINKVLKGSGWGDIAKVNYNSVTEEIHIDFSLSN